MRLHPETEEQTSVPEGAPATATDRVDNLEEATQEALTSPIAGGHVAALDQPGGVDPGTRECAVEASPIQENHPMTPEPKRRAKSEAPAESPLEIESGQETDDQSAQATSGEAEAPELSLSIETDPSASTPLKVKPEADPTRVPATAGARMARERCDALAAAGDFPLSYWYAIAAGDSRRALLARAAFLGTTITAGAGASAELVSLVDELKTDVEQTGGSDAEAIAASLVPAALLLPPFSLATIALDAARVRLGDDCPEFIRLVHELTYKRGSGLRASDAALSIKARDEARDALLIEIGRAPQRNTRFQRATEVWRDIAKHSLADLAASAMADPADPSLDGRLRALDPKGIAQLIAKTDSVRNPMQARRAPIIAGAAQEISAHIQRYLDSVSAYLEAEAVVRRTSGSLNGDVISQLVDSVNDEERQATLHPIARGVAHWLAVRLVGVPLAQTTATIQAPLVRAYELERSSDGSFPVSQVTQGLLDALSNRSDEEAFAGFIARHDFVGMRDLLDLIRSRTPELARTYDDRERTARAESKEVLNRALDRAKVGLSRAVAVTGLMDEAEAQREQDRLERIARDPEPHFREALVILDEMVRGLGDRLQTRLDAAALQLDGLTGIDESARARVRRLIEERDLLSAEEFIAQLTNGATTLPEEDLADTTLDQFWPAFTQDASGKDSGTWFSNRLQRREVLNRPLPPVEASRRIVTALDAWDKNVRLGRGPGFENWARDILQGIGFDQVQLGPRFTAGRSSAFNLFTARYNGYALIPTFGSAPRGQYSLLLCWDRTTVDGLLQAVTSEQRNQARPTVVLYFRDLKHADRRLLAETCRRKGLHHLVIDNATMAFLGTREEPRFDTLMHVGLPFTGANPYTPFVLGDVPPEVFYGRRSELQAVQDPNGPLFVYGGRQLGKSALLKTAKSKFEESDDHHFAIYLDLKAEGVGEWRQADYVWRVLLPALQDQGIGLRVGKNPQPENVAESVRAWLAEDERRRMLLLLDESDAFLDEDSHPRGGAKGQFKNVFLLKNLMNQTQRRFKPVFAGLHQVQRFHKESNSPMAHVGAEIAVGPLPPAEAFKLVSRPLQAIGYRFTSPDVVWRLLSHTNYQASLIQLFCSALVTHLKNHRVGLKEPPTVIDAAIVDAVFENKELRSQIAQRFEWTIHLDNRYRVIATVAAWLNLTSEATVVRIDDLRSNCAFFWPAGFESAPIDEFRSLLDEMVGLGVLVRDRDDRYGIRSPNVIRLLGSLDEIQHKLEESASLDLPTVFDPTRHRRRLKDGSRSPLTEAQAARMLYDARIPTAIVAPPALGADRIAATLEEIAESGDGVEVKRVDRDELVEVLTRWSRRSGLRHLMWDARGLDRPQLVEGLAKLRRWVASSASATTSVLLGPDDRPNLSLGEPSVRLVVLAPWSDAELHAVEPEADVELASATRTELLEVTGGWPRVLEGVLETGRRHGVQGMLNAARQEADSVAAAGWEAFATSIALHPGSNAESVLSALVEWGESISRADLTDLLPSLDGPELERSLMVLESTGAIRVTSGHDQAGGAVYQMNPLVARCWRAQGSVS